MRGREGGGAPRLAALVRNVVFMGMGEPLNNYKAVTAAVRQMIDSKTFSLRPRCVTVSTVGVVPRILWNGLVVGAATPLKSVGFYLARDGVILELFDEVARNTNAATQAGITIG